MKPKTKQFQNGLETVSKLFIVSVTFRCADASTLPLSLAGTWGTVQ